MEVGGERQELVLWKQSEKVSIIQPKKVKS